MKKFNINYDIIFFSVAIIIITLWFSLLPLKLPFDWIDIFFESAYLIGVLVGYIFIRRLNIFTLRIGWTLFSLSLLLNVLDEFTRESSILNPDIEGIIGFAGLMITAVGFYSTIRIREKEIITRKAAEEKLFEYSEYLKESNSMKELLLDIITHDLKNPIGVIKGFSQMGLENDPGDEILKEIDYGADGLINVINNATVLSKVTIGDNIEKERVNLTIMIKNIAEEFSPNLQLPKMTLDMQLKDGIIVNANPIIGEIFRNYISNAIKYAQTGKQIVVDAKTYNNNITVNVKDFGETIQEKDRKKIFTRKYQINSSDGRGLGLSIVKRIAEAHNAEVGVKPNVPKGNNFYLRLPLDVIS